MNYEWSIYITSGLDSYTCFLSPASCIWYKSNFIWWWRHRVSKEASHYPWSGKAEGTKWNSRKWVWDEVEETNFWCKDQGARRTWHFCSSTWNSTSSIHCSCIGIKRKHYHWRSCTNKCMYIYQFLYVRSNNCKIPHSVCAV